MALATARGGCGRGERGGPHRGAGRWRWRPRRA